ncbi:hypothetical protein KY290_024885 [Solanum tuberosum]|uniref:Uncharacterized protein n=1 Tax=Solanum tuberosum TaxID=4113 RepID=A0ABQ7UV29_SOLTU|nr:hypothetical protein KY284_023736 [Solanum tuberosum]KAH0754615.1 hypothetical protein KY290_024885 [Solanum tuberosum]
MHILEVARAIRFHGLLPLKFMNECVLNVIYVIDRLPLQVLYGKAPYEVFYDKVPSLQHMRTIRCLCFTTNIHGGDKFSPRDVSFREKLFPFQMLKDKNMQLFLNGVLSQMKPEPTPITLSLSTTVIHSSSPPREPSPDIIVPTIEPSLVPHRRFTRTNTTPTWLQEYLCGRPHSTSISSSCSYLSKITPIRELQSYNKDAQDPLQSYNKDAQDPILIDAMKLELAAS